MTRHNDSKHSDRVREQPLTYEDYARLPDESIRYELADGVLEAMTPSVRANM